MPTFIKCNLQDTLLTA